MDDIEVVEDKDEAGGVDSQRRMDALKNKLRHCETEKREYLDGWQRSRAELINLRREEEKRFRDWKARLENDIISQFLSIADSFDIALGDRHREHLSAETEKGFALIRSQLENVLKRLGVTPIEAVGRMFDPKVHEAIEEITDEAAEGIVMAEPQRGYLRNGELLRPAQVKISKGKEEPVR